ncbi:MAG: hypothetical protein M0R37_15285 [Bacteroidales bacterium]|jgi:hypothetical protein|nr:hypothetical protein [Bacteroidales bacterium]
MTAMTLNLTGDETAIQRELLRCAESPVYFLDRYGWIYDATARDWVRFALWAAQARALRIIDQRLLVIILKARQLGMSWLVLGYALWLMLFRAAATVLLFSKRDDEAVHLLTDRLKGMYAKLPVWMRSPVVEDNDHEWGLQNGSMARAFPTSAGDSYTATLAVVDEADLVPDLGRLMRSVKPTIDGGGRMILLSRADKGKPGSEFKRMYREAKRGHSPWTPIFLPWNVRPGRDAAWYAAQKADILARTTSLDDLHEQYPATETEALAPRTLDKRIAPDHIERCYRPLEPIPGVGPAIPGLEVYVLPVPGRRYVVGADPAEGNPTSDDSALTVGDVVTGEEVAALAGKFAPATLAAHADTLAQWYNQAEGMVERNNHGHAVLLWLSDNSQMTILSGYDGKPGWLDNSRGKTLLYDTAADAFREQDTVLHSFDSYVQLASIEGSSLRAPEGDHDDRADSYALMLIGRVWSAKQAQQEAGFAF